MSTLFFGELVGRGYRIDWIMFPGDSSSDARLVKVPGGAVHLLSLSLRGRLSTALSSLLAAADECRLLLKAVRRRYSVIQIKDRFFAVVPGLLVAKISGARFTYWMSYPYAAEDRQRARSCGTGWCIVLGVRAAFTDLVIRRLVIPFADHIFVQSEEMRRTLVKQGARLDRTSAVPMGVDAAAIAEAEVESVDVVPGRLCYLGSLSALRQPNFLIDVLARVKERDPRAHLYLIGRGESPADEQSIRRYAFASGLSGSVTITGQLTRPDAWRLVRSASVCLSPIPAGPLFDVSSPTKLVEYLALGRPVVASVNPEQSALMDGVVGSHCVPLDVRAFAEATLRVLADQAAAEQGAAAARTSILKARGYPAIADAVDEAYMALVSQHAVDTPR